MTAHNQRVFSNRILSGKSHVSLPRKISGLKSLVVLAAIVLGLSSGLSLFAFKAAFAEKSSHSSSRASTTDPKQIFSFNNQVLPKISRSQRH